MSRTRFLPILSLLFVLIGSAPVAAQDDRAGLLAGASARDYAHSPSMNRLLHWARFPVHVFVATHDPTEEQAARAALAGFDQWVRATSGAVRYAIVNDPARADIDVRFTPGEFLPGQPGVAGVTTVSTGRSSVLRRAYMRLATGRTTAEEMQSVAAHEFGHALGIGGHSDDPADLMYPVETRYIAPDGTPLPTPPHPLTLRDLKTLQLCYPRLFIVTPTSAV